MSAFFVGRETINAAATFVLMNEGPRSLDDITAVGQSLWTMNALALEERYESEYANDYLAVINGYEFSHMIGVSFAALLKATDCLLYQCAEGNVPEMALYKKLKAMADRYGHTKLSAQYEAAPWGLCG